MIVIEHDALIGNVRIVVMAYSKNSLTDSEHGKFYRIAGITAAVFIQLSWARASFKEKRKRFPLRQTIVDTGRGLLDFDANPLQTHLHWRCLTSQCAFF